MCTPLLACCERLIVSWIGPEQHVREYNCLFDLVCDLQMKHTSTWCNTRLLQTHQSTRVSTAFASKSKRNILLIWSVQTTIVLPTYNNRILLIIFIIYCFVLIPELSQTPTNLSLELIDLFCTTTNKFYYIYILCTNFYVLNNPVMFLYRLYSCSVTPWR
jgi:hypothetical protein